MARIAGVDIPNNKRVEIALTYIYGIGLKSAQDILAKTGVNPDTRAKDLTEGEIAALREPSPATPRFNALPSSAPSTRAPTNPLGMQLTPPSASTIS